MYRKKYQGIKPPVSRSEDNFDPGTIYHVVNNVDYSRFAIVAVENASQNIWITLIPHLWVFSYFV